MYQLGTVAKFNSLQLSISEEVRQKLSEIATMLDEKDLACFREKYTEFASEKLEYVLAVEATDGNYLNAFYFYGYDYGISLFMPVSIAPEAIMREALNDIQLWNG